MSEVMLSGARDLLAGIWLFSELDTPELDALARLATRRHVGRREVIVRKDDPSADLYAIVKGHVKVSTSGPDGREIVLNVLKPGQTFGEIALLDGHPRSATVTATEACDLLVLRRKDFLALVAQNAHIGTKLLETLARLVRQLSNRSEDLAFLGVRQRLAKRLVELATNCGTLVGPNQVALRVRLSQQELGDLVQATRESVNKCFRDWARDGIVHRTRAQIVIQDRVRLQLIAGAT